MIDVFIFSSPRSGSTLLRLTLDKLHNVATLPETHFFVFYNDHKKYDLNKESDKKLVVDNWIDYYTVKRLSINHEKLRERLINKEKLSWRELLDFVISAYLETKSINAEKSIIIEKSPPHIFYQQAVKEIYPEGKFIYLFRDPRDVVASLKTCSWSTANVSVNAKVWKNGVHLMNQKDALRIKYEDLVKSPEGELDRVCNYIGIDFDAQSMAEQTSDEVESKNVKSKHSFEPISEKFISSYKDKLSNTDRDIAIIQNICEPEMKQLGYQLDNVVKDNVFRRKKMIYQLERILSKLIK